jgi:methylamine dehydrogenase accessory protein MauD
VALASDGEPAEQRRFIHAHRLESFPYLVSTALGLAFRVSKLPFAVLIDREGRIRAKGLVNTREQIESLLNARALGVASLQEYRQRAAAGARSTE